MMPWMTTATGHMYPPSLQQSPDNHYSMAGINPYAKILPIKVLDSSGGGDTEQIAAGIMYAADNGAKVLNLSLGGGYSRTIEYALHYASNKGVTIVAASGNDGMEELNYPGSSKVCHRSRFNQANLISSPTFSNYGKGLDLVAPGSASQPSFQTGTSHT